MLTVSVPLRGKGRDQRGSPTSAVPVLHNYVSVPLRGKGRDQRQWLILETGWNRMFPSPCGEKVGINPRGWRKPFEGTNGVSVPLRGKGRDQHSLWKPYPHDKALVVSVPLRGKGRDQR